MIPLVGVLRFVKIERSERRTIVGISPLKGVEKRRICNERSVTIFELDPRTVGKIVLLSAILAKVALEILAL